MDSELHPPRALPHLARLLRAVDGEDAPAILLWGLPGSGRRRLLGALAARDPAGVGRLSPQDASGAQRLSRALRRERDAGAGTFVCDGWAPDPVAALRARLLPGERAIASVDRLPEATEEERAHVAILGPGLWLLERGELEGCVGAEARDAAELDGLYAATGGWLRPVELALDSAGGLDLAGLLEREGLRRFLLDRVWPSLSAPDDRLTALGEGAGPVGLLASFSRRRGPGDRSAAASPRGFELRLLGVPEVVPEGARELLHWPYRRVVALLGLLALEREHGASQERVLEALWPDRPVDAARANLNPAVSHLRRWLSGGERVPARESCVVLANGVYRLHPDWSWRLDVEEFESLLAAPAEDPEQRLAAYERARGLYRGSLLEGFGGRWLGERRRRLTARYHRLLRDLGDLHAELGRLSAAEDSYRSLLAVEPLEEDVHVAVMRLYARQGREDLVRRQYERLSALLVRELGMQPMDETIREVQRLLGRE
ncbi:MAG TPA: BTAD domain-containing putative transcriptional regulator [Thermoanaerobaculia bacterium]|nr:BTAD domain-containing putative transcriptional regulator [Thermoanaerobaculia bacterium]